MEDVFPKEIFSERHEFSGVFSKGDKSIDDLQVIIQYSLINGDGISGKIIGKSVLYDKVKEISASGEPYCSISYEQTEPMQKRIFSDKVIVKKLQGGGWPKRDGITYPVAHLELQDMTTIEYFPVTSSGKERYLTFFLLGPRKMWEIYMIKEQSHTGDVKVKAGNAKVSLDLDTPMGIEVSPYYFFDKTSNFIDTSTDVLALHMITKESVDKLADEEFIKQGEQIVEDIILLISFISKGWVDWYRYSLQTDGYTKNYVRKARDCTRNEESDTGRMIDYGKCREFLKIAFSNLRKLRMENFDISMPIVYYVSASEKKYVEEKFSTYFLALEKIKDMYTVNKGMLENIPKGEFNKLAHLLREYIKEKIASFKIADKMIEKINELNRPSLRLILVSLLDDCKIDWRKFYPASSKFTLIKTRNDLFHSSKELDMEVLPKELYRLASIVECILLYKLGWNDMSRSPASFMRKWLIEE